MQCPACEAPVPADGKFCSACGAELDGGAGLPGVTSSDATEILVPDEDQETLTADSSPPASGWSAPVASQPSGAASGTLGKGRRLGDRYEIVQLLGEGGMGAVYKAKDIELDRLVAIKVIRPDLASDPDILQRFKQEIILARDVTHRNVVRIFDLGQAEGVKFISMEFVEGRDLHGLLKETGPLPVEEAVEIMEQVCLALSEAHQAGVVHRDLKPQNIMLDDEGRVVVMDFGIARSVQVTGMTQTGSVLGTPDFMSPEQVKGQAADARSDIFALGIIFYQLLTGEVPYKGDTPMASMYLRTQERAKPVREVNPEIPGFLGDVIARSLEISPQRRYQSARELLQDLEMWRGGTPRTLTHTLRRIRPARPRLGKRAALLGAAAVLAVAITLSLVLLRRTRAPDQSEVAPALETISLAILPFRNMSGSTDIDWLSAGLAEMLRTDVGESAHLRTVSADRVHQVMKDLRISSNVALDATARRRIAEFSNAETLVWGQYLKLGEQIRIDVTVEDLKRDRRTPVKIEVAGENELLAGVAQLAELVRENLALSDDRIAELEAETFEPSSDSVTALRFYTQGLELIRQGNNLEAVQHFERSVTEDPGFALAYSKLGETYHLNGRQPEAVETSRRALQLSEGLPPQERYQIVAADARIQNDLERGVEAYQSLLERRPDDPDLHFELGALYASEGLFDQAQEHFARTLAADPQNLSALLASGGALTMKGDAESALEPLSRALTLAVQLDNQEMESNVLQSLGQAYRSLNRLDDSLRNFERSLELKRELGDTRGMAASLNGIAWVQDLSGNFDQARESYEETIRLWREIGDERGVGIGLMNLGDMERIRGNYDESLRLTREALQIQIDMNDEFNQGLSLNNIGATYYLQGKYDDALVYYQRALEIRKRLEVPSEIADTLHNLGETYETMGRFDRALDHYLQAVEIRRDSGDARGAALESYNMGKVFVSQGRYGAALEAVTEARAAFEKLQDRSSWYAETLAWQGYILSLLGRSAEAAPILEEALALAQEWEDPWLLAQTLNFEGDRSLYAGDFAAARAAFTRALEPAGESGDPLWELTSRVNLGRAGTASGQTSEAVGVLEGACVRTGELGLRVLSRKCAIHLGIARLASGDRERGVEGLRRAIEAGEELTPPDLRARAHWMLAAALRADGEVMSADAHAATARELVEALRREAGSDSLLGRADLTGIVAASTPKAVTSSP